MTEKTREQIEKQYKWDLSTIYKNDKDLESDYNQIEKQIKELNIASFLKSADNLFSTLKTINQIQMILEKMYTFTSHRYDTDLANNHNQAWKEKIYNLYIKFDEKISSLIPEILEFGQENIENFYKENKQLKEEYSFLFENIFREKDHVLSSKEEQLISSLNKAVSDTGKIASMLTDSDISFGTIKDEQGNEVELTDTNYSTFIISKDQNVRKEAFYTLYKSYKQFNNTLALSLAAFVEKEIAFSKVRNFKNALEASLFYDAVSTDVYDNLIETVNKNLDAIYKYYKIKQKALNLDEFHIYDSYVEIANEDNKKYTFDEAKQLVLDSLKVLGNDYVSILEKAFKEKWIDIYPNKGKRGGAYSGGSYLTNPFVLLNFKGTYHDVSTIAHELGHSLHSYYSRKNNPFQYSDYKIFVAEVASQVNELILNNYMLNKVKTKQEKLNILNQILDLFKGSIVRQTMFAEFEKEISFKSQNGEILTADNLNKTYYNLVKKYFGEDVVVDEEIKYEWSRIPHFYYDFYVYKYSTGLAAACHIAKRILNQEPGALEGYLNFLKTGGSDYPLEELKIAGVDLTKPEVIQSAMDMFKEYLDQFEKLLDS